MLQLNQICKHVPTLLSSNWNFCRTIRRFRKTTVVISKVSGLPLLHSRDFLVVLELRVTCNNNLVCSYIKYSYVWHLADLIFHILVGFFATINNQIHLKRKICVMLSWVIWLCRCQLDNRKPASCKDLVASGYQFIIFTHVCPINSLNSSMEKHRHLWEQIS